MALRVQDSTIVRGRDGTLFAGDDDAIVRSRGVGPASVIAQTCSRDGAVTDHTGTADGILSVALAVLPAGQAVSTIGAVSGATALTVGVNQWAAVYTGAAGGARLAVSADKTSEAWAANTVKEFALATPFTPVVDTLVYLGICIICTNNPSIRGLLGEVNLNTIAPIRAGTADTGLTTPATAPATLGTVTPLAAIPYIYAK